MLIRAAISSKPRSVPETPPLHTSPFRSPQRRAPLPWAAMLLLAFALPAQVPTHAEGGDKTIACAPMGHSAQAVAKQVIDATDADLGASNPKPRSVRCEENTPVTNHPSGAEPMENAVDQISDRRWRERGLKRASHRNRPHVSIESVESVEQDLRWAHRAMDRGEHDRAFRILARVVDRAARVPAGEAAQAFDILADIGDAHMAAGQHDRAAAAYRALVTLGTHLDENAAATADSLLRSASN